MGRSQGCNGNIKRVNLIALFTILCCFCLFQVPSWAKAIDAAKGQFYLVKKVYVLELTGSINPGSKELFERAVERVASRPNALLLVFLNTPGGLISSLRAMVQAMMASNAPVVVFVYPPGAQAASAGALLTLAAHVSAMAPGTNIGAAHPVSLVTPVSKDSNASIMAEKVENDVAAMARSIAQTMGRNATWAERAVRESISATAHEALEAGAIDLIAQDVQDLLERLKGKEVRLAGKSMRLRLEPGVIMETITPTLRERVLSLLGDPNIAYILMMIGIVGLYFELSHPGVIFPGTIGAVSLLLALFAMQALPVSAVGLLLIFLGVVFFVLELVVVSHGLLGAMGLSSMLLGSLMLFKSGSGVVVSLSVLLPTLLGVGVMLFTVAILAARATFSRPKSGVDALKNEVGTVKERIGPNGGLVFVHGELWRAFSDQEIEPGEAVRIKKVHGLRLEVTRK